MRIVTVSPLYWVDDVRILDPPTYDQTM